MQQDSTKYNRSKIFCDKYDKTLFIFNYKLGMKSRNTKKKIKKINCMRVYLCMVECIIIKITGFSWHTIQFLLCRGALCLIHITCIYRCNDVRQEYTEHYKHKLLIFSIFNAQRLLHKLTTFSVISRLYRKYTCVYISAFNLFQNFPQSK